LDSEDLTFNGKTVGFPSRATPSGVDGLAGWARAVRPGPLRRADPAEVTAALAQLTRFGPFFAVHLDQQDNAAPSVAERISSATTAGYNRAYRTPAAGSPPRTPMTLPHWSNAS
jgi:hypothetical protein